MAYPTPKVEIAFDDGPYVASPTWTDVTSYVRGMSVDRGRSDDWGDFYGSATVTLNNRTRLFDPFYTSGTYNGKLLPRRQIRITGNADPGRTNLVLNPSFETNTNFNIASNVGTTLTRSSLQAYSGSFSGKWDYPSSVTTPTFIFNAGASSARSPVTVGQTYTFSVYVYTDVPSNYRADIRWATAISGGSILDTNGTSVSLLANTWTRYTVTGTCPVGYSFAQFNFSRIANAVTGTTYLDAALFEQSATAGTYFDGSTVGYGWNGTANASTSSSVYQPVFRGYINGWPPSWTNAGQDSTVTLSCMDALGLLASETLPADWSRKYILSTSPRHYWPCDEPITPFVAGSVITDYGSVPLNMTSSVYASNGTQLAQGLVNSAIQGTANLAASGASGNIQGVGNFSASAWLIPDTDTTYGTGGETYNCNWAFEYESTTSSYRLYMLDYNSSVQRIWYTVQQYDGGAPRMLSFTFNGTTKAITFYVNGVAQTMTTVAPTGILPFPAGEAYFLGSGQTQQFIVWDGIQTQTVFENIYKYSTVAFNESTAARFNRIIGETAFPASLTSPPSSPASTVLELTDDAPRVASELQKVADSEYGQLFVSSSGVVTLYYQTQIRVQTRSTVNQMTVGSGGLPLGQDVVLSYDGDSMRNVANVTMSAGGVFVKKNTTSITARGAAEESIDTQVATTANAESVADIIINWGGNVYANAEPFQIVTTQNSEWATILDRELNDRITLAVQPPSGNLISIPMLISRISFNVVPGEWQVFLQGSARWAVAIP